MADKSKIEWCDATWNPVTGCSPVSDGCTHCYASRQIRSGRTPAVHGSKDFSKITFHLSRLDIPLHWKKPRRIFVCSMGDLFHEDVPLIWQERVFDIINVSNRHTFMILTKRPELMREFFTKTGPPMVRRHGTGPMQNVWLGVTVENSDHLYRAEYLMQTPAAKRFVSVEPCLSHIDFKGFLPGLDWVICGGESGPGARPMHLDWARSLRDQCQAARVPFFMKQMSKKQPIPDDLMVREFPNAER